jgi:16S rRNA (guanine527-N7)-methyltransferase
MISNNLIVKELRPYGVNASDELCSKIRMYIEILLRWNAKMSLTTVTDPIEIIRFHFGESIFALTSGLILDGRLADLGTGAGFPGIPLFLARPSIHLTLIESNIRKCVFLREVVRKLDVERDVKIWNGRMVDFSLSGEKSGFDYVSARAVGRFGDILSFARSNLDRSGRLVLWVGADDAERIVIDYSKELKSSVPIQIPNSNNRYLLSGSIL